MLEIILCSLVTILPDYLVRRFVQGKRIGREITFFSVWYELRYGLTACFMLTVSLITIIFFYHPSSSSVTAFFRTVPIIPDASGRVEEVYRKVSDTVAAGDPLFRLDTTRQEASAALARNRIAETDAAMAIARADIAAANGKVAEARAGVQQIEDDLRAKRTLNRAGGNIVAARDIEKLDVNLTAARGALASAEASRQASEERLGTLLPAQRATAESSLRQAEIEIEKSTVRAGVSGRLEQFALRKGDVISSLLRPAGLLVPSEAGREALQAGFGQIAAPVIKPGMIGEVACNTTPWRVTPVVVSDKQDYIASGQFRLGEQLVDVKDAPGGGTILVYFQPLYAGGFKGIVPGSQCVANVYSNHHDEIANPATSSGRRLALHVVDALAVVHALLLRIQVVVMPIKTLVLSGH